MVTVDRGTWCAIHSGRATEVCADVDRGGGGLEYGGHGKCKCERGVGV